MMTTKRAQQILSCYGGNPDQWPTDERTSLQQLLLFDTQLQKLQQQERSLDRQLKQIFTRDEEEDTHPLEQSILASLPNRGGAGCKHSLSLFMRTGQKVSETLSKNKTRLNNPLNSVRNIGIATLLLLIAIGMIGMNGPYQKTDQTSVDTGDAWLLMANTLVDSDDQEWLVMLEPELIDDDLYLLSEPGQYNIRN